MTEDPRALRSRALLHFAVRDLLLTEGMAGLSVASLCRRAGLHRTTFYQHYEDLASCVADAVGEPLAESLASALTDNPVPWTNGEVPDDELYDWAAGLANDLGEDVELFNALLARGSGNDVTVVQELLDATSLKLANGGGDSLKMRLRALIALSTLQQRAAH